MSMNPWYHALDVMTQRASHVPITGDAIMVKIVSQSLVLNAFVDVTVTSRLQRT